MLGDEVNMCAGERQERCVCSLKSKKGTAATTVSLSALGILTSHLDVWMAVQGPADGRCAQSVRRALRVARPRSSLRLVLVRCIPKQMYFIVLLILGVASSTAVADFCVTVSSSEARHILI